MISVKINNSSYLVNPELSIIESCKFIGIILPRFCYHEKLSVAANCRMCLVEIDKIAKPVTACSASFLANSIIYTNTPLIKKARENIIEALLLNHPLDCPICDQAGECDLQDQVTHFGSSQSRFYSQKKQATSNKNCGPLVKTIMTRCIHCTRCIRFSTEIAGVEILGTLNRGGSTEIGTYIAGLFHSEISGNVIDLCPVGALTANFYSFELRPWELYTIETIDLSDSFGSNIYVHFNGFEEKPVKRAITLAKSNKLCINYEFQTRSVVRVLPKINEDINGNWISDRARFSFDSLKNNRLYQETYFFSYNNNSLLPSLKTTFSYPTPSNNLPISFFVDENVDLEILTTLNKLKQKHFNVSLFSVDNSINRSNYKVFWDFDQIASLNEQVKYCFLFGSNIKTESVLLSTKLKSKSLNQNITVVGLGLFYAKSPLLIHFVNLTLQNIIIFVEGKNSIYSKSIISDQLSLFCFGESFMNRCNSSYIGIINQLKTVSPTSIFYQLNKKSNTFSFGFLGIRQLNSKNKNIIGSKFFYNLDLNFKINKILSDLYHNKKSIVLSSSIFKSSIYWFNSYKPTKNIFFRDINLIPSLTAFESEGIHFNLEGRPQRNSQLTISFSLSLKDRLLLNYSLKILTKNSLFNPKISLFLVSKNLSSIFKIEQLPEFSFVYELIYNFHLFAITKRFFSNLFIPSFLINFGVCLKYPIKASLIDIYTMNSYLKNSWRMAECSREVRKISNNFY